MLASASQYPWFALSVKPRHEKAVAQQLSTKGLEQYLPLYRAKRRWSDRFKLVELPLFPGYVFCRFEYEERLRVLQTLSVTGVVGFGGTPTPVPDLEIESVKAVLRSGLPVKPWPFLRVGQQVRVTAGSLTGVEGMLVREKGLYRVVVNVELLQRSVAVEIDRSLVAAVHGAAHAAFAEIYMVAETAS